MREKLYATLLAIIFSPVLLAMRFPSEPIPVPAVEVQGYTQEQRNVRLVTATREGYCTLVRELLAAGAQVETCHKGWTALLYAAEIGLEEICRMLLDAGANPNARGTVDILPPRFGEVFYMPLAAAAHNSHEAVCRMLIAAGADVNNAYAGLKGNSPMPPLLRAVYSENVALVQLFLQAGADLQARGRQRETALMRAAWGMLPNICELIVAHQKHTNDALEALLQRLYCMKKCGNQWGQLFYNQRNTLLLPYLRKYIPIKELLDTRDDQGKRACDYLKIECLNPDLLSREKMKINEGK